MCVWGPGSDFLGKSGSHGTSVESCVCAHMPGFLGDTDVGLYRAYIWGMCGSLQCLWRGPGSVAFWGAQLWAAPVSWPSHAESFL